MADLSQAQSSPTFWAGTDPTKSDRPHDRAGTYGSKSNRVLWSQWLLLIR